MENEPRSQTGSKVTLFTVLGLIAILILFIICFYGTDEKEFFYRAIQVLLGVLTVVAAVDCVRIPMRVARMESRDRETIGQLSTTVMSFPIFTAFTALSFTDYIPRWHFPWVFLVGFLTISVVFSMAQQTLTERETGVILRFLLIAFFSALLTVGQIALAEYFDTWLFLVVRSFPIPVLGLTVALSALISVYCFLLAIYAAVFHALRRAYSVK